MSKIAKLFITNIAMNHFLWESLAAFHKANPFQGIVQSATSNKNQGFVVKVSIDIQA